MKKYDIFQPFQKNLVFQIIHDGFSPYEDNSNVLLVPNLFMYEYLVLLLFGERIVCSPYKKFGYKKPTGGLFSKENGFNRGYYQYSLKYDGLSKSLIDQLSKLESDWGKDLGYYGTIDIPYTTFYRVSDLDGRKKNGFFLGTDALGVTPEIFKELFSVWKSKITSGRYTNLSPAIMIQLRKNNNQTFLLRFKNSEFKKKYVSLADNIKRTQSGGAQELQNRTELFQRAVEDSKSKAKRPKGTKYKIKRNYLFS